MLVIQMSDGRDEILNPYSCPKYQIKIIIGVQGLNNQHWKRSSKKTAYVSSGFQHASNFNLIRKGVKLWINKKGYVAVR